MSVSGQNHAPVVATSAGASSTKSRASEQESGRLAQAIPEVEADRELARLFGNNVYAVGGRIRDGLLSQLRGEASKAPKDLDYVVAGLSLEQVRSALSERGLKVDEVGASFAVLKVDIGGETIDLALPRAERSTGPAHRDFEVVAGPQISIAEDALRRDFTINAISLNLASRRLNGPDSALRDIKDGRIRALSPSSFSDDPLRLLRAAQFASRLEFEIEPGTLADMKRNAALLRHEPPERIKDELIKILEKSKKPSKGFEILRETGLLEHTIPELIPTIGMQQNRYHRFDVWTHIMTALDASAAAGDSLNVRTAVLLHDIAKPRSALPRPDGQGFSFHGYQKINGRNEKILPAHEVLGAEMTETILRRLRFSEEAIGTVKLLVAEHMYSTQASDGQDLSDASLRRFLRRVGAENVGAQFAVRRADVGGKGQDVTESLERNARFEARVNGLIAEKTPFSLRHLPIDGKDVIAAMVNTGYATPGYRGGKDVGAALENILQAVIENPALCQREDLLRLCESSLAKAKVVGKSGNER